MTKVIGGNNEIITNGINGLLVSSKDENALARAIVNILKNTKLFLRLG